MVFAVSSQHVPAKVESEGGWTADEEGVDQI